MNPIALAAARPAAPVAVTSLQGSPAGEGAGGIFAALCGNAVQPVATDPETTVPPEEDTAAEDTGVDREEAAVDHETGEVQAAVPAADQPMLPPVARDDGASSGETESAAPWSMTGSPLTRAAAVRDAGRGDDSAETLPVRPQGALIGTDESQAANAARRVEEPANAPLRERQGAGREPEVAPEAVNRQGRSESPDRAGGVILPTTRKDQTPHVPNAVPIRPDNAAVAPSKQTGTGDVKLSGATAVAAAPVPGQVEAARAAPPIAEARVAPTGSPQPQVSEAPPPMEFPVIARTVQTDGRPQSVADAKGVMQADAAVVEQQSTPRSPAPPTVPPMPTGGAAATANMNPPVRAMEAATAAPGPLADEDGDAAGQENGEATALSGPMQRNGAVPRPAEVPVADVARQIARATVEHRGGEASLTLDPEELGVLRVTFSQQNGETLIQILAERPDTADLMRRHAELLLRDLAESGVGQARLSFSSGGETGERRQGAGRPPPPSEAAAGSASAGGWSGPARPLGRARGLDMRV